MQRRQPKTAMGHRKPAQGSWGPQGVGFVAIVMVGIFFILSGSAWAHKVSVFAYAEGGKIYVEGYFSDGTPTAHAKVRVADEAGKPVVQGQMDKEGHFQFSAPSSPCDLSIELDASLGHRARYLLKKEDWSARP
ncbi:nickel transport protein [Desulfacinum hydrothermale DSM 13146]|uniref:Nickel transport protein n=1 Tax=Desulfacinum hydrothermale DSM 13146 TaxID=1121390 RepID=A0A1W1XIV4_9BACT|nr:nickel transport protein [Desulfacinum hydrothermale DSM 13146]